MYIVIVGCGRVGSELARLLSSEGHDIVVVDKKEESFQRLGDAFNGLTIKGNGVSTKTLQDAGIEKTDVFCSLTNSDNINIMASQVAKRIFKVPRVIARVYDPQKAAIYKALGLNILSETSLFASMIRDKIMDEMFSSYLIESGNFGVLEFPVSSEIVGKKVGQITVPGECVITVIRRKDLSTIIPDPTTVLMDGDVAVVVVKVGSLKKVKKNFGLS